VSPVDGVTYYRWNFITNGVPMRDSCRKGAWILGLSVVAVAAILAALHFAGPHDRPRFHGFKTRPAMSFAELQQGQPFVAVVESKEQGVWKPTVDSSTGKPVPGAQPTEYVMVYLVTDHGKKLCICQQNPSSNEVAFVSHLRSGQEYSFPDVFDSWQREQSK
jgi:hypothetical protein